MPTIGTYQLHSIETGRFALDGGAMFGVVPKTLWSRTITADEKNRIPMAMRCLLLKGDDRIILIDAGAGDKFDEKYQEIYAIDHRHSNLLDSLSAVDVGPGDVTDVILTHLHFDHCGGCVRRRGDQLEVVFNRAVHHVQGPHWEWAAQPNVREKASFLRENLEPLRDSGLIHFHNGGGAILPGIEAVVVNGHTRAQQLVKITGEEGTLVYVGDLIPTTRHIPVPWIMGYDVEPLSTLREKEGFLKKAAKEEWHLFFEHDDETEIGTVIEDGKKYVIAHGRPLVNLW